jgi:hypothetical protein
MSCGLSKGAAPIKVLALALQLKLFKELVLASSIQGAVFLTG